MKFKVGDLVLLYGEELTVIQQISAEYHGGTMDYFGLSRRGSTYRLADVNKNLTGHGHSCKVIERVGRKSHLPTWF